MLGRDYQRCVFAWSLTGGNYILEFNLYQYKLITSLKIEQYELLSFYR